MKLEELRKLNGLSKCKLTILDEKGNPDHEIEEAYSFDLYDYAEFMVYKFELECKTECVNNQLRVNPIMHIYLVK